MVKLAYIRLLDRSIRSIDSIFPANRADFLKLRLTRSKDDVNDQKLALEQILRSMHTAWCTDVLQKEYKRTADKISEINKILASSTGGTQHTSFGKLLMETMKRWMQNCRIIFRSVVIQVMLSLTKLVITGPVLLNRCQT